MKYIAIVGTNASFSYNRKLLWYMKKHFSDQANIEVMELAGLPLFCEDEATVPKDVKRIADAIETADGIIFSTPEYDHAITAALKSLIEWLSWGPVKVLAQKPVMIVGTSLGSLGTVFAQENLRQVLSSPGVEAFVLPTHQFLLGHAKAAFNEQDDLREAQAIEWLEQCFKAFVSYCRILKPLHQSEETKESDDQLSHELELSNGLDPNMDGQWQEEVQFEFSAVSDADTGASEYEIPDQSEPSVYQQLLDDSDDWLAPLKDSK